MNGAFWIGWVLGYAIGLGIFALVTFWVVRGAILSALAEDRHRVARAAWEAANAPAAAGPPLAPERLPVDTERPPEKPTGWWDRPFGG